MVQTTVGLENDIDLDLQVQGGLGFSCCRKIDLFLKILKERFSIDSTGLTHESRGLLQELYCT
jgi:hypothetical protein